MIGAYAARRNGYRTEPDSVPRLRIPAIVSFLNPQPALGLVGGNRSSCPVTAVRLRLTDRRDGGRKQSYVPRHPLVRLVAICHSSAACSDGTAHRVISGKKG